MINTQKLIAHIPNKVLSKIPNIIEIKSDLRLAHFLSQCAHESANFTRIFENLNYSAEGLRKTFPKYFNYDESIEYAHKPQDIANRAYANRLGNGNEHSGDGWKYRARGYIQITGKENYILASGFLGKDLTVNPDIMATEFALESAAWFFTKNNIWQLCDKGSDIATITAVTKKINGGSNGIASRIKLFNNIYSIILS
jgi:putative chitinase